MSSFSRICMWLGLFLLVAGSIYGATSHEPPGTTWMLIGSGTIWVLAWGPLRDARQEGTEIHVAPTIWPLGFAISAVIIGLGLIVSPWILIPGGVAFVLCAAGWLRDVARSHASGH